MTSEENRVDWRALGRLGVPHECGDVWLGAVSRALHGRRRDEVNRVLEPHWVARFRHADDRAKAMAGGIIRGASRTCEQDHGNVLQAFIFFDDRAEIMAGEIAAFHFRENHVGNFRRKDRQRLTRGGYEHHLITVVL